MHRAKCGTATNSHRRKKAIRARKNCFRKMVLPRKLQNFSAAPLMPDIFCLFMISVVFIINMNRKPENQDAADGMSAVCMRYRHSIPFILRTAMHGPAFHPTKYLRKSPQACSGRFMHPSSSQKVRSIRPEYKPSTLAKLDRRTREAQLMQRVRKELTDHVGGEPSAAQAMIIEQAAQLRLRIALMDRKLAEQGTLTDHDARTYIAWSNALIRTVARLGTKGVAKAAPSLADYLASNAEPEAA